MEENYEAGMVTENLEEVEEKIQAACNRSGRKREEVTLIAVSKTKPVSMIKEAYGARIRVFGENKVQELTEKYDQLPSDIQSPSIFYDSCSVSTFVIYYMTMDI